MTWKDRVRARMRDLAAELGPDDGLRPHELLKLDHERRRPDRKTLQLCAQVRRAAELALAAAADPVLRQVQVLDVTPAPDAAHLLLHVGAPDHELDPDLAIARVCAALPWLRAEVAHHVTRRRAPHLKARWEVRP